MQLSAPISPVESPLTSPLLGGDSAAAPSGPVPSAGPAVAFQTLFPDLASAVPVGVVAPAAVAPAVVAIPTGLVVTPSVTSAADLSPAWIGSTIPTTAPASAPGEIPTTVGSDRTPEIPLSGVVPAARAPWVGSTVLRPAAPQSLAPSVNPVQVESPATNTGASEPTAADKDSTSAQPQPGSPSAEPAAPIGLPAPRSPSARYLVPAKSVARSARPTVTADFSAPVAAPVPDGSATTNAPSTPTSDTTITPAPRDQDSRRQNATPLDAVSPALVQSNLPVFVAPQAAVPVAAPVLQGEERLIATDVPAVRADVSTGSGFSSPSQWLDSPAATIPMATLPASASVSAAPADSGRPLVTLADHRASLSPALGEVSSVPAAQTSPLNVPVLSDVSAIPTPVVGAPSPVVSAPTVDTEMPASVSTTAPAPKSVGPFAVGSAASPRMSVPLSGPLRADTAFSSGVSSLPSRYGVSPRVSVAAAAPEQTPGVSEPNVSLPKIAPETQVTAGIGTVASYFPTTTSSSLPVGSLPLPGWQSAVPFVASPLVARASVMPGAPREAIAASSVASPVIAPAAVVAPVVTAPAIESPAIPSPAVAPSAAAPSALVPPVVSSPTFSSPTVSTPTFSSPTDSSPSVSVSISTVSSPTFLAPTVATTGVVAPVVSPVPEARVSEPAVTPFSEPAPVRVSDLAAASVSAPAAAPASAPVPDPAWPVASSDRRSFSPSEVFARRFVSNVSLQSADARPAGLPPVPPDAVASSPTISPRLVDALARGSASAVAVPADMAAAPDVRATPDPVVEVPVATPGSAARPNSSVAAAVADGSASIAEVAPRGFAPNGRTEKAPLARGAKIAAVGAQAAVPRDSVRVDSDKTFLSDSGKGVVKHATEVGTDVAKTEHSMPTAVFNVPASAPAADRVPAPAVPLNRAGDLVSASILAPETTDGAHRAVEAVLSAADRVSSGERHSVNLDFSIGGHDLSVRVEMRADQVHATFRTDSADLRTTLAHEWQSVNAGDPADRSQRLAAPVFTSQSASSNQSTPSSSSGGDGSSRHRDADARQGTAGSFEMSGRGSRSTAAAPSTTAAEAATALTSPRTVTSHRLLTHA